MGMSPRPEHYVLSDLHLGHEKILQYCRTEFKNIQEHDDMIINNINEVCGVDDYLWLLGDIAWSKQALKRLSEINCKLALIGGNHDDFSAERYLEYFVQFRGVAQMKTETGTVLFSHVPMHPHQLRWYTNIHGHLHNDHIDDNRYINVSCEPMKFRPQMIYNLLGVD